MANPSPLEAQFEAADAQLMPFGEGATVVAMHDVIETEYAPVRKGATLMDCPHRALVELTGGDRQGFLHNVLTQDINAMGPGQVRRAFMLTAQGRIIADLFVVHGEKQTWLDVDVLCAQQLLDELDKLLFSEDVQIIDHRATYHRLSLHGPKAMGVLERFSPHSLEPLEPHAATKLKLGMIEPLAFRDDECGEVGLHLWTITPHAPVLWQALLEAGEADAIKPLGWLAYNIARIEAGSPLFMIDFGSDSLPGETGLLDAAVSFTKGCYRGQEIVARMKDIGHPAKTLVGFDAEGDELPVAGTPVYAQPGGDAVGAVTSSTPSPMRSGKPIGIAMVKWDCRAPGTTLHAPAEGATVSLTTRTLNSRARPTDNTP